MNLQNLNQAQNNLHQAENSSSHNQNSPTDGSLPLTLLEMVPPTQSQKDLSQRSGLLSFIDYQKTLSFFPPLQSTGSKRSAPRINGVPVKERQALRREISKKTSEVLQKFNYFSKQRQKEDPNSSDETEFSPLASETTPLLVKVKAEHNPFYQATRIEK
jgi:hypothetical protein